MVSATDLKFYLTTADAGTAQSLTSQSIGGHVSTTPFNRTTTLSAVLGQDAASVSLSSSLSNSILLLPKEILSVTGTTISERAYLSTIKLPHPSGSLVTGITANALFNNTFSDDRSQYRCVAVRNENATESFYNLEFYLKDAGLNEGSTISLAVEYANKEVVTGTATGGGSISLVDSSLIGAYDDNYFAKCPIIFTSGSNINLTRTISSFDSATGTIVFTTSLTVAVIASDQYRIMQSPSQRLTAGTDAPAEAVNISAFYSDTSLIEIDVDGNRTGGNTLAPYETVYVWIKRQMAENAEEYLNNRAIFAARYTTS